MCAGAGRPAALSGSTLHWLHRNGELPGPTARVSFIHDWIGGLLAGQLPVTDPSDAGSAGIFDLTRLQWHEEIARILGLPGNLLPPVRPSGEIIGQVCADASGGKWG